MVHFGFRRVARGLNGKMARGLNIVSCLLAVLPSCLLAVLIHNFGSIYQSQVIAQYKILDNKSEAVYGVNC